MPLETRSQGQGQPSWRPRSAPGADNETLPPPSTTARCVPPVPHAPVRGNIGAGEERREKQLTEVYEHKNTSMCFKHQRNLCCKNALKLCGKVKDFIYLFIYFSHGKHNVLPCEKLAFFF